MIDSGAQRQRLSPVVPLLAVIVALAHLATAGHYPLHQDELYYIACGRHLDWCFPDHPPLVPWLASVSERFVGTDPTAIRLWPALASGIMVLLSGLLARDLGGNKLAQLLATMAVALSPLFLVSASMLQTVVLDQLFWLLSTVLMLRLFQTRRALLLLPLGLVLGLGLLAKLTMAVWCLALLAALLVATRRRHLASPWFALGILITMICALPILSWQVAHDWPTLEFMAAIRAEETRTPWGLLAEQVGMSGPMVGTGLAVAGLISLLRGKADVQRPLGIAALLVWLLFLLTGGKAYYAGPIFPLLFAAGAVAAERWIVSRRSRLWAPAMVLLLGSQAWMLPAFLPVMSPERLARWIDRIPNDDWRRMFGWEDVAIQAAGVHGMLNEDRRTGLRILTSNYSLAGAIDLYGPALGLPAALSGHNGYAYWEDGPRLDPLIVLGHEVEFFRGLYHEVIDCGVLRTHDLFRTEAAGEPIFYCRGLQEDPDSLWLRLRHFD